MSGTEKWFNSRRGYGFITCENGKDAFVHYSAINMEGYRELEAGDAVEFTLIETPKGPQAVDVIRVVSNPKLP